MKVIFVIGSLSGGGAERVVVLLANKLVERNFEVLVVTDILRGCDFCLNDKVKIIPFFRNVSQQQSVFRLFFQIYTIRKLLKQDSKALVVGIMPMMYLLVYLSNFFLKNKIIASDHTSFQRPLKWHMNFIRKFLYRRADAVTMLSEVDSEYVGSSLKNKWVIPNPLAFNCIDDFSNKRENIILAVGRLDVWYVKGFDLLLQAWAKIYKNHKDWILEIAGRGSDRAVRELDNLIQTLGISSSVRFSGFHPNIDELMRKSSIFVLSSRQEGFGLVLIEAMSQGCACISFDCQGRQKEIINDAKCGIIIENHNVEVLADKLNYLITNSCVREYLSINAVNRARDFDINRILDKWISLFLQIQK